jgi:spore germination protein KA
VLVNEFGKSSDLIVNVDANAKAGNTFAVVYLTEMVDNSAIAALSDEFNRGTTEHIKLRPEQFFTFLQERVSNCPRRFDNRDFQSLFTEILDGNIAVLIDGVDGFFCIDASADLGRGIDQPTSQTIIKGPKDAFTEDIDKNLFLIRKRIRNKALKVEDMRIGTVTNTKIKMLLISTIAKPDIVDDMRDRLSHIDYDCILDSGYIEQLIKTDKYSIFPTILNSEKPDAVAGALWEGRGAVIVDGTPYVLAAPAVFSDFVQSSEDYYYTFYVASAMRLTRYIALFLTLLVPALYIALTTFHQEIVPTPLLVSIAGQREGVPFPAFLEVLIMEIAFEVIREAGIRMPRAVGPAISIVGALVLGQAAVEAGLISALVVIIVAVTAISSFAITNYGMSNSIRLLRFVFILLASTLGLYGMSMGLIILMLHLCKLKSLGVPYLTPVAPKLKDMNKDALIRYPLWTLKKRPAFSSADTSDRTSGPQQLSSDIKGKQEIG